MALQTHLSIEITGVVDEKIQDVQGKVISAQETGTFVDGLPLYRILASINTTEGTAIEGEALRICRPYLAKQLLPGNNVTIVYNKTNPTIFSIVEV